MTPIKSSAEELADCRAAFAAYPDATHVWCAHHEQPCEKLTDLPETRITYILENKPEREHAVRFRNFRPMISSDERVEACVAIWEEAWKIYEAVYEDAREGCEAACEDARKVCVATCKEAQEAVRAQWNKEWPDNTWTGTSIFNSP